MKKLILLIAILISIVSFAQVPSYVPTNGLVGWWPFNGNANDESGNGNNGTVNGATLTSDRNGVANKAYNFDGVNDFITINSTNQFVSPVLSISVYIKPMVAQEIKFIEVGNSNSSNWSIYTQNDFAFGFRKNESCVGFSQNQFLTQVNNEWIHLIIITDSFQTKLYKNGILMNIMPSTNFNSNCPLSNMNIGLDILDQQEFWNGKIDEIGIWNRVLTNCEISNLYNSHVGPLNLSAGSNLSICNGNIVTLTASGATTYSWSNNVINAQSFAPTTTQNYILTGTDSFGCTGTDTVEVVVLNTSSSSQTQTALDSYTWLVNNQTYTQSGSYSDTLINAAGCDSIVTLNLTLSFTGINELNASSLSISPNPTAGDFTIAGLELYNNISTMRVSDVNGKLVKELDPTASKFTLGSVKPGVYFLTITAGSKQEVIKIIKE